MRKQVRNQRVLHISTTNRRTPSMTTQNSVLAVQANQLSVYASSRWCNRVFDLMLERLSSLVS